MMKTRIGILGYGNLGKGVELAARQNDDIELVAIFSRRDPSTITPLTAGVPVFSVDDIEAPYERYRRARAGWWFRN